MHCLPASCIAGEAAGQAADCGLIELILFVNKTSPQNWYQNQIKHDSAHN
jgi:hypothetical protein